MLTPYRSLSATGFVVLMAVLAAVCLVSGLLFMLAGAWPVLLFFGLDVAVVWLAFTLNYRAARAFEEVEVALDRVIVRKVSPAGRVECHRLNPYWARLAVDRLEDEGVVRITLRSHGVALVIGSFLNPPDRESFARALDHALAAARRGGMPA